jgi:hypothetical protein
MELSVVFGHDSDEMIAIFYVSLLVAQLEVPLQLDEQDVEVCA